MQITQNHTYVWKLPDALWHEMEANSKTLGCLCLIGKIWAATIQYWVRSSSNKLGNQSKLVPGVIFSRGGKKWKRGALSPSSQALSSLYDMCFRQKSLKIEVLGEEMP